MSSRTDPRKTAGAPDTLKRSRRPRENLSRIACLALAAAGHIALLVFIVFDMQTEQAAPPPQAAVMKLVDIQEYAPPAPPPPQAAPPSQPAAETIAEEVVEVEELEPQAETAAPPAPPARPSAGAGPEYLLPHKLSVQPEFDKTALARRTVYPTIARRANIEGSVMLELFIDKDGFVRNIIVLKETPEGRGFAEAAVRAFQGFRAKTPAQANGEDVAARIRWPVRFSLK